MSLAWIWTIAATLAAISIAVMLILVLLRVVQQAAERSRSERQRELVKGILSGGGGREQRDALAAEIALGGRSFDALVLNLAKLVRGDERERILDLMRSAGVLDALIRSLNSGKQSVRVGAAGTLRLFRDDKSAAALRGALDDSDSQVRLAAAASLAALGAAPPISELLAHLRLEDVQGSEILRELFRRLVDADPPGIVGSLDPDNALIVRLAALDAMGRSGNFAFIPHLAKAVAHDPELEVRAEALRALGNLGHPRCLPAIQRAFGDLSWEVRTQAAVAAGRLKSPAAVSHLSALLDDAEWWPRFRAAEALAALEPFGIEVLKKAARQPARRDGAIARDILLERGLA